MSNEKITILHTFFHAALHTPTSVYLSIQSDCSFLLESAQQTHLNQYSMMGSGQKLISGSSAIDAKISITSNSPVHFMTHIGYLAYDVIEQYHGIKAKKGNSLFDKVHETIPKSQWIVPEYYCVYDHVHHVVHVHKIVIGDPKGNEQQELEQVSLIIQENKNIYTKEHIKLPSSQGQIIETFDNLDKETFLKHVDTIKKHILYGDVFQCVLSRQVLLKIKEFNEFQIYTTLRHLNPSPYMYFMQMKELVIVGASPELFCSIKQQIVDDKPIATITSHPIAGTRPRGKNDLEDTRLKQDLLADKKECAEHVMLVDLARNDIGRVIPNTTDSVKVTRFMEVDYFSHVMHMVSEVKGTVEMPISVKNENSTQFNTTPLFDVVRGLFPAGTLSGAPKHRAMQLIKELEPNCRSIYGGLIGYLNGTGGMDSAICIRTMVFTSYNNERYCLIQAGAGIVADSVPELEYAESNHKMKACFTALNHCTRPCKSVSISLFNLQILDLKEIPKNHFISDYAHFMPKCDNPVVLIDNYDSFTFNVYHLIHKPCVVVRNDQFTKNQIIALNPSHLIISPGPGTPQDAGISAELILHFKGRIPILGICLGHQLICTLFDGTCNASPYLMHGKSSKLKHDQTYLFQDIPNDIDIMRYHSLLGQTNGLIETCHTHDGLLMGARHPEYTIEGVQFHPESIKTEYGQIMMNNFLKLSGGKWPSTQGIIDRIVKEQVDHSSIIGKSYQDLLELLPFAPKVNKLNLKAFLIIGEFKRASPSQPNINLEASFIHTIESYKQVNINVVSILTEVNYFKGHLDQLREIKMQYPDMVVLRKDFIVNKYQLLESRIYGADLVLLIVSRFNKEDLRDMINYTHALGMEALVEVYSVEECEIVNELECELIGINNRDLKTFKVNKSHAIEMQTLLKNKKVIALSGIKTLEDINYFRKNKMDGVLIGQSLMQTDPKAFMEMPMPSKHTPIIKFCGITTKDAYNACDCHFIGFMFVPESIRYISDVIATPNMKDYRLQQSRRESIEKRLLAVQNCHSLNVGVFMDQSLVYIEEMIKMHHLDVVQLHGQESKELVEMVSVPVIKTIKEPSKVSYYEECYLKPILYLLDHSDGSGKLGNWDIEMPVPFIMAGGINIDNCQDALKIKNCIGIDVSSGLESAKGVKDVEKMKSLMEKLKK